METLIINLIKTQKPFSIIQYFEWFKADSSEKIKCYELVYINSNNRITTSKLDYDNVKFLKEFVFDKLNLFTSTKDGKVWEYKSFKNYVKENNIKSAIKMS